VSNSENPSWCLAVSTKYRAPASSNSRTHAFGSNRAAVNRGIEHGRGHCGCRSGQYVPSPKPHRISHCSATASDSPDRRTVNTDVSMCRHTSDVFPKGCHRRHCIDTIATGRPRRTRELPCMSPLPRPDPWSDNGLPHRWRPTGSSTAGYQSSHPGQPKPAGPVADARERPAVLGTPMFDRVGNVPGVVLSTESGAGSERVRPCSTRY
jgi:hypothetical protein